MRDKLRLTAREIRFNARHTDDGARIVEGLRALALSSVAKKVTRLPGTHDSVSLRMKAV